MIVWLASYPRSGNTFFRVLLNQGFGIKTYSLYDDREDIGADERTSDTVGHQFLPVGFDLEKARKESNTYYIKTHELLDNRVDEADKIVYLIRDGRDSTLSLQRYQKTFFGKNNNITDMVYGKTFVGEWGEHVLSWASNEKENLLLVKFEELTRDPLGFLEIISSFIGERVVGREIPCFDELKEVNPAFFRQGKTNVWEESYTDMEHISFWMKNYSVMKEHGYTYKMPDAFKKDTSLIREVSRQNSYLFKVMFQKNQALQEKERVIVQKNQALQEKERVIVQKNQALQEKEKELQGVYTSRRWRLVSFALNCIGKK